MAKVAAIAWLPRSYIHLFETYRSIGKIDLEICEPFYDDDRVGFKIKGFKDYPDIVFTQGWSGLHVFTVEMPDEDIRRSANDFMSHMQSVLVDRIIKSTHTVTYKQIAADVISVDFHLIVLTRQHLESTGYKLIEAGEYSIAYRPEAQYGPGNKTYVIGEPDEKMFLPLLYHAYTEVAFYYIFNLMKAMIRLYHEADSVVEALEDGQDMASLRDPMDSMDRVVNEFSQRYGKLRQILLNFKLKESEFYSLSLDPRQKEISEALKISRAFNRLEADGAYMSVLWSEILEKRINNIDATMDARVLIHSSSAPSKKKGWF